VERAIILTQGEGCSLLLALPGGAPIAALPVIGQGTCRKKSVRSFATAAQPSNCGHLFFAPAWQGKCIFHTETNLHESGRSYKVAGNGA
jgi:hypothetical protein